MLSFTFSQKSGRNKSIDLLRFIGLSLIILAHVGPPYALFNLRCFDVPMMLFISGLVYSGRKSDFGFTFLVQRVLRLIIPVYIFLTAYFLVSAALKYFAGIDFGITMKHVVGSYLLTEGIGYVWIIRVFLIIAVLTPGLIAFNRSIQSDVVLIMILIGISLLLTFAIRAGWGMDNIFVREFVYYAVAYSIPFIVGLRVMQSDRRKFFRFFAFVAIVAAACGTVQAIGGGKITGHQLTEISSSVIFPFLRTFHVVGLLFYLLLHSHTRQSPGLIPVYRNEYDMDISLSHPLNTVDGTVDNSVVDALLHRFFAGGRAMLCPGNVGGATPYAA